VKSRSGSRLMATSASTRSIVQANPGCFRQLLIAT
jgi:hypothetical protein